MKLLHQLTLSAAMSAMLIFAASEADAQGRVVTGGWSGPPPRHGGGLHGRRGFGFPVFFQEREVVHVIEREVVREVPAEPPPAPEPEPRKPYVIGATYASLPSGCMKLIEEGASYYLCSGEWYRQVSGGYRAVEAP